MSDFELHNLCREERVRENHELSTKILERHSTPPPAHLASWESAGLLSGRSRVQTPAGPILKVFR